MTNERAERRLTAILAADVAGYSRLMGADEEGTHALLKAHRRELVDPKIAEYRGRIVKTTGDGMLVQFSSVTEAVRCAVDVQRGMAERNAEVPSDRRIEFRVGINLGDVIIDGDDIYGDGVNVAARLEGLAEPNGVCVSRVVRDQVRDKLNLAFEDLGEQEVKNIARPVRVFRIAAPVVGQPTASTKPMLALPDKSSIAVLPFQNMSGDPDQKYFADGMAEDIISALSRVKSFFVIARNSSFTYKGRAFDVKRVGRELGVRYVLEGSVRRSSNRLRITAQLVDAQSNAHIWSDRYDGDMADVFDLQDRITESVVGALEPTIRSAEIERARRKRPESLDAYDLVMRALPSFWAITRDSNIEAIALLERAMAMDRSYAFATALCAWSYAVRNIWLWTDDPARERDTALRLAMRAVGLDSEDPFVLAILGSAYTVSGQLVEAVPLIEKSLAIDPNSAFAWVRNGWLKIRLSDPDAAIACFERAMRISPLDPYNFTALLGIGCAHLVAERFEQGAPWITKSTAARPSATYAWMCLVAAYVALDRMDEAREALAKLTAGNPGMTVSLVAKTSTLPNPAFRQLVLEGLRKAGLPE